MSVAAVEARPAAPSRAKPSDSHWLGLLLLAIMAAGPFLAQVWGGNYVLSLAMKAMLFAIAVVALDLLVGRGGMVSFGHAAFVGVGAYVTGIALTEGVNDAPTLLALALLGSGLFALVAGAISLRTSGVYFIMITLALGQMLFFSLTSLAQYGGDDGLTLWRTGRLFDTRILQDGRSLYWVILGALALTWVLVGVIVNSRFGRVLRAGKENPTRVAAMGFTLYRYRLTAFVIAGMIAGLSGFLLAHQAQFVSPAAASWQRSGEFLVMVVLGGMGTRNGPLLGALAFVIVEEALSSVTQQWRLIFGPLLILVVLGSRGGLAALIDRLAGR
jgi:branched-chain amino acid transport system permease protein